MLSKGNSSQSATVAAGRLRDQAKEDAERALALCRRLVASYDFQEWKKIMERHRVVMAEASIAESLRPADKDKPTRPPDLTELSYYRGYGDALHWAATYPDTVIDSGPVSEEKKEAV